MARILALSAVLSLTCELVVAAQQRSTPIPMPRPAPVAPVQPAPVPDSRFTSTLVFRGQRTQPTPVPFPLRGIGGNVVFPVLPFLWGWGVPAFYVDAPVPLVPPPGDAMTGGVQLDVLPWRARVYVDGVLAGRVDDFRGYYHHLDLVAGAHQIAIVEQRYQPLIVDVVVTPGRTITYRATLNEVPAP